MGSFHLAQCLRDVSMLLHMSVVCSFLLLGNIPTCGCSFGCLSIYQLRDIFIVFIFGWLGVILLHLLAYRSLCAHMCAFLLNRFLLCYMVYILLCKTLENCFPRWLYHFAFSSAVYEGSSTPLWALTIVSLEFWPFC